MAKTDGQIIQAVTERMSIRRNRDAEQGLLRSAFTLSYAVSVSTGNCYVGYNVENQNTTSYGSGSCAENRALYVAETYNENIGDLVFFALNDRSEFFNACNECQRWIWHARGFLKNQNQRWIISTAKPDESSPPVWRSHPLTDEEQEMLYASGERTISDESRRYFSSLHF